MSCRTDKLHQILLISLLPTPINRIEFCENAIVRNSRFLNHSVTACFLERKLVNCTVYMILTKLQDPQNVLIWRRIRIKWYLFTNAFFSKFKGFSFCGCSQRQNLGVF